MMDSKDSLQVLEDPASQKEVSALGCGWAVLTCGWGGRAGTQAVNIMYKITRKESCKLFGSS